MLLKLGFIYILTVYIVYVLSGMGFIWFQVTLIHYGFAETDGIIVGVLVITLGLVDIKEKLTKMA